MNILVVDDEKKICTALADFIKKLDGCKPYEAYNGIHALEIINSQSIDLIISDVKMPEMDGIELSKKIVKEKRNVDIILMSGQNDIIESINSLETGVNDFLIKPIDILKLKELIIQLKGKREKAISKFQNDFLGQKDEIEIDKFPLSDFSTRINSDEELISASSSMKNLIAKIIKLHEYPEIPILIEGKTGTGKEKIAALLHYGGNDNNKPFIALNCAALSKNLFESELFGYEKGSFTDALSHGKDGKIKLAENGSLFLDEITEIPLEMQAKLLRVLQEKEYYKVGGFKKEIINTRIITSTNRNLSDEVKSGNFREDLYYRLNVCKLNLISLSERKDDILPLAVFFIKEFNKSDKFKIKKINQEIIELMKLSEWPGNVRELKNSVIKACLFNENDYLKKSDFDFLDVSKDKDRLEIIDPENFELPEKSFNIDDYTDNIIKKALKKFNGNITQTSEFLGLKRSQFYYRYKNLK